jgi:hypothetical protein
MYDTALEKKADRHMGPIEENSAEHCWSAQRPITMT